MYVSLGSGPTDTQPDELSGTMVETITPLAWNWWHAILTVVAIPINFYLEFFLKSSHKMVQKNFETEETNLNKYN